MSRNTEILPRIPAARRAEPEGLQGVWAFLASAACNYLTGCGMAVNGGRLAP